MHTGLQGTSPCLSLSCSMLPLSEQLLKLLDASEAEGSFEDVINPWWKVALQTIPIGLLLYGFCYAILYINIHNALKPFEPLINKVSACPQLKHCFSS